MSGIVQDPAEVAPTPPPAAPAVAAPVARPVAAGVRITMAGDRPPPALASAVLYLRTAAVWGLHNWKTTVAGTVSMAAFLLSHETLIKAMLPPQYGPAANTVFVAAGMVWSWASMDGGRVKSAEIGGSA